MQGKASTLIICWQLAYIIETSGYFYYLHRSFSVASYLGYMTFLLHSKKKTFLSVLRLPADPYIISTSRPIIIIILQSNTWTICSLPLNWFPSGAVSFGHNTGRSSAHSSRRIALSNLNWLIDSCHHVPANALCLWTHALFELHHLQCLLIPLKQPLFLMVSLHHFGHIYSCNSRHMGVLIVHQC